MLPRLPRRLALLLLALLASFATSAQPDPIKFGKVDYQDLVAAPLPADSGAAAVVLCDYGRSRLEGYAAGFRVVFDRVTRIKILTKAGYDHATVEIPLYHRENDQEKVSNLRGFTYSAVNGAVHKTRLETSGVFLEKRTATQNVQKFSLPNVHEGSIIEYSYTLSSDFLFNFQDWSFQWDIPVRWSEYRVSIPVFYKYKIIYQGVMEALAVNTASVGSTSLRVDEKVPISAGLMAGHTTGSLSISAPTEEHRWVMKALPALRPEAYITTASDYVPRLDFELAGEQWPDKPYHDLTGNWELINRTLLADADFGQQLDRGNFLKDQMQALATKYPEVKDRAAAVREVVMAAVRYDGTNRYSTTGSLRRAYDAHRGTAAEVNLLLIAALRDADIPAQPVLLSTRDHGQISKEFPLVDKFNYVVALVQLSDGKDLLVDATEPLLPCGMLPERCLNQLGRLIARKPEDGRWIDLTPTQRRMHFQNVQLSLNDQGGLTGKVHEEYSGHAAASARGELSSLGEKKYWTELARQHSGWALPKMTVSARDDVAQPLVLDYEFTQPADDAAAAGTLYLSPLREFGTTQNPFRYDSRSFPIDFGMPQEETVMLTLALPAGYELAALPKPMVVELSDNGGRFVSSCTAAGSTVQLSSRLTLRKPVYAAAEYGQLRELYRLLLEKQAEKLVIKKKV
jgi:hypothetical protein